jgi:hypothetical protein
MGGIIDIIISCEGRKMLQRTRFQQVFRLVVV